jgi:HD-GYP domain-containing protein (c-di-GMP phosphodiesterase class II)/biotin operon repressor
MAGTAASSGVRRGEIIAALSMATDLAMGQPIEFALRSCLLGMRLGGALRLSKKDLAEIYFQALLRYIGCNAETYAMVALFGDELALRRDFALVDMSKTAEIASMVLRHLRNANADAGALDAAFAIAKGFLVAQKASADNIAAHCEAADRLAARLALGQGVRRNLGQIYERWDGRGLPNRLRGEAIAPAVRVVVFAQDVVILRAAHGTVRAADLLKGRRGKAYDPRVVDCFFAASDRFLDGLDGVSTWDAVLGLEPSPRLPLSDEAFDEACLAMADFADLKSPFTIGHSRRVSQLAAEGAHLCGLSASDIVDVRRAGLLHDIGRVGISARIWLKTGPLTDGEREQIRLHAHYGERVLARSPALARLGAIVAQHHERLDGSGYHRGSRVLSPQGRILAAADAYCGRIEERPHRAALSADAAADTLRRDVRGGRLDVDAVAGVLAAAGHRGSIRRTAVGGLTEREVEVLRAVTRGHSMKEIGRLLGISPKTVDNHLQNLYAKIGVKTRAGATLYAIEHSLVKIGS